MAKLHPVPRQQGSPPRTSSSPSRTKDAAPTPAGARPAKTRPRRPRQPLRRSQAKSKQAPANTEDLRHRLFALPQRSGNAEQRRASPASSTSCSASGVPGYETFKSAPRRRFRFDSKTMELRPLQGRLQGHRRHRDRPGRPARPAPPHLNFAIRPAGRGAPTIDPKPILDGWKLLETTAIYRAAGQEPVRRQPTGRPGPADVEVGSSSSGCSPTRRLSIYPAAATTSPPARSTAACSR